MTKEQIDFEQKILEELWKESSELLNKISTQIEKLKKMTDEYNSNRELTLSEIFHYDYLESTYKYYKKWCEENGFSSGGYFPDTEQYALRLCFNLDDKKKVKKQKFNLNKYLEIAKPKKDDLYDLVACNFYPYSRNKNGYEFNSKVKKANGGLKNVEEYVVLAIQRAKEKGIVER